MAKIIDLRESGGQLVLFGDAFTLPSSNTLVTLSTVPVAGGSLRYNPQLNTIEYILTGDSGWSSLISNAAYEPLGKLKGLLTETTNYTLQLSDFGSLVEMNLAGANTLTIPPNTTVPFALNTKIEVVQLGAGSTTVVAGAGVTIHSNTGSLTLNGRYSRVMLYQRAADEWVMSGAAQQSNVFSGGTVIQSAPIITATQTWSNSAAGFTGLLLNITNANSAANSILLDLQANSVTQFKIDKFGNLTGNGANLLLGGITTSGTYAANNATLQINQSANTQIQIGAGSGIQLSPAMTYSWGTTSGSSGADLFLYRDGANVLAQRNGANAQTFRLYNTFTDSSNYERGFIRWNSNALQIGAENLGTGVARSMDVIANTITLWTGGASKWQIANTGTITATTDNTYDIGGSSAGRPRNVYAGGLFVSNTTGFQAPTTGYFYWQARSQISSPVDGTVLLQDNSALNFNLLSFGGTTNAYPSLKRNGTGIDIRLADDSNYGALGAQSLRLANSILTGTSSPVINAVQTWNNATTVFTGILSNITDSNSSATSLLLDLQVGGTSKFSVDKSGGVVAKSTLSLGGSHITGIASARFGSSSDAQIWYEAANALAMRVGTNPQIFRVYNTFTDSSNYERFSIGWSANTINLNTEALGTGSKRNIAFDAGTVQFNQTWNNANTVFTGILSNVTDSNSSSTSLLLDLQVGSTSLFSVNKTGKITSGGLLFDTSTNTEVVLTSPGPIQRARLGQTIAVPLAGSYNWANGTQATATIDLTLSRAGPANLQLGPADAASPVAQTLSVQSVANGTANAVGVNFTINGSRGTGTGAGGDIIFQTTAAGTAGSTQNVLVPMFQIKADTSGQTVNPLILKHDANGPLLDATGSQWSLFNGGSLALFMGTNGIGIQRTDSVLAGEAANTIAQRNGANAQTFRIYNTYTDASNYERLGASWAANVVTIQTEKLGTGTIRDLIVGNGNPGGNIRFTSSDIRFSGSVLAATDNTYDIGASGATRPRSVYVGTSVSVGNATVTASAPALNISQTWSNSSVTFTGLLSNITDSNSAADSILLDLQIGGTSKFKVLKNSSVVLPASSGGIWLSGNTSHTGITAAGLNSLSVTVNGSLVQTVTDTSLFLTSGIKLGYSDAIILRDAANNIALRNSTNAQKLSIYNTYTDASNYARTSFYWSGNTFTINTEAAGTGTQGGVLFNTGGNAVSFDQPVKFATDNTYDIGASGANRPRHGYFAGTVSTAFTKTTPVLVSALPAASGNAGLRSFVTDSTVVASGNFGATVAGGGANSVPVYCDGTNWCIG